MARFSFRVGPEAREFLILVAAIAILAIAVSCGSTDNPSKPAELELPATASPADPCVHGRAGVVTICEHDHEGIEHCRPAGEDD